MGIQRAGCRDGQCVADVHRHHAQLMSLQAPLQFQSFITPSEGRGQTRGICSHIAHCTWHLRLGPWDCPQQAEWCRSRDEDSQHVQTRRPPEIHDFERGQRDTTGRILGHLQHHTESPHAQQELYLSMPGMAPKQKKKPDFDIEQQQQKNEANSVPQRILSSLDSLYFSLYIYFSSKLGAH